MGKHTHIAAARQNKAIWKSLVVAISVTYAHTRATLWVKLFFGL
jgi:hypothetical protein